ncbi:MAG: hypothetical protein RMJ19_10720 [Gemmatales bacterium]|nr:hypothetical protein [Gemmatales bacterium]MDW8176134.1 hypothetical protein [Gemmatales bacterium]
MPAQSPHLEPQILPRELLADPEPAPAPRVISTQPHGQEPPVCAALRAYLLGQPETASETLRAYEEHERQFLLRLFPALAQLHQTTWDASSQRQLWLGILRSLTNDLQWQAPLQMRQVSFCRRVLGYGKFDPVPNRFASGEAVGLYCEVENLQDQELGPHQYGLALKGQLEIRDARSKTVWHQEVHFEPDVARSPRQDHFLFVRWRLPENLSPGQYQLVFTLRDVATERTCQAELPLRITSSDGH